jgi:hypothetical protein
MAEQIWKMSDDYIAIALQHLCLRGPFPDRSKENLFDSRIEFLRVGFLFPGIAEQGLVALVSLREMRWRSDHIQKGDREMQTPASAHTTEQFEGLHESKCDEVRSAFRDFSAVQREIIQEKFFCSSR